MPPSEAAEPADSSILADGYRWFPLAVLAYYALHLVLRTALGGGAGLDDAEQIVATQIWAWGYGPQPPLYTWLQKPLFELFGINVFSFALLRNVLLAATALTIFAIGQRLDGPRLGALAAGSMMLLPQFAWEAQRALSHSTLAVLVAALAVLVFLDLVERRQVWAYLAFGALWGLAFLSKANAVILPAGLLAAGLLMRQTRPAILDRRILLVPATAAAVIALPLHWMTTNAELVLARTNKFGAAEGGGLEGALNLILSALSFVALLAVVWLLLSRGRAVGAPLRARLLAMAVAIALAAILLGVLLTGTTQVKERWLLPVLFLAPVLAAAWFAPRLSAAAERWFWRLIGALAIVVLAMIPVHHRYGGFNNPPIKNADFAELLDRLEVRHGPIGTVFAENRPLGGNLRMVDPGLTVVTPEYPLPGLTLPEPWLAVWRTDRRGTDQMPEKLVRLLAARGAMAEAPDGPTIALPWTWPFSGAYSAQGATVLGPGRQQ